MTAPVVVRWDMTTPERNYIARDQETLIAHRALDTTAVEFVAADFWEHDHEAWREYFGDDTSGWVMLDIERPFELIGTYSVRVERVVHAHAQKIEEKR